MSRPIPLTGRRAGAVLAIAALTLLVAGCFPVPGHPGPTTTTTTTTTTTVPEGCDAEPNNTLGTATSVDLGSPFDACNSTPAAGDIDYFSLGTVKGGFLTLDCTSPSAGTAIVISRVDPGDVLVPVTAVGGCVTGAYNVPNPNGTYVVGLTHTTATAKATLTASVSCDLEPNDTVGTASGFTSAGTLEACNSTPAAGDVDYLALGSFTDSGTVQVDCTQETGSLALAVSKVVGGVATPVTPVGACVSGFYTVPAADGVYVVGIVHLTADSKATLIVYTNA